MNALPSAIACGKLTLPYEVIYTKRKTLELAVHPDKSIVIRAPFGTGSDIIENIMRKRRRWIQAQMDFFERFEPRTTDRRYLGGETHLYLGRQYRLKIVLGADDAVILTRGFLTVHSSQGTEPEKIRKILDSWYTLRAKAVFLKRFDLCFPRFKTLGYAKPQLTIRKMKTRWGSLSGQGNMTLNRNLIKSPCECIDYVITHELCHQKHPQHDQEFYKLLEKMMPDWKRWKHKLEITMS